MMMPDQQPDVEIRGYLTAFVDLLGLSNRLLEFEKIGQFIGGEIPEDFKKEAARTAVSAEWLRDSFITFYQAQTDPQGQLPPGPLSAEQLAIWNRQFPDPPTIQWFSDCILVSIPIRSEWPVSFYRSLHSLVLACAMAQIRALVLKLPARGGIAIGYGARLNTGEILGAGLAKAYQLESKEANYPRILIDPELIDTAKPPSKPQPDWKEREFEIVWAFWRNCLKLLRRDRDGYWFVDFFNEEIFKLMRDQEGKMVGILLRLIDEAMTPFTNDEVYPRNATSSGRGHFAKWTWLANYWKESRGQIVDLLPQTDNSKG
ncbi:MAG: hypothetical protein C4523_14200 [Myxococcales bacterium]|nr:MAG: hypothetical protein C4523_14200 [Myxococcales bacterium]